MRVLEVPDRQPVTFVVYGRWGRQLLAASGYRYSIWSLENFDLEVTYSRGQAGFSLLECFNRPGGLKFLQTAGYWKEQEELPSPMELKPESVRELNALCTLSGFLCFGPDGTSLFRESFSLPWSSPQRLALWTLTGELQQSYPTAGFVRPTRAVFSPDGATLALSNTSALVSLLDTKTGEVIIHLEHTDHLIGMTFSEDGRRLATSSGRTVRVWSVPDGKCMHRFRAFRSYTECRAFAPDGSLLVAGSREGRVRVWEVESGRELSDHNWGYGDVGAVAFSPDGLTATAGCLHGVVVWDVDV